MRRRWLGRKCEDGRHAEGGRTADADSMGQVAGDDQPYAGPDRDSPRLYGRYCSTQEVGRYWGPDEIRQSPSASSADLDRLITKVGEERL